MAVASSSSYMSMEIEKSGFVMLEPNTNYMED